MEDPDGFGSFPLPETNISSTEGYEIEISAIGLAGLFSENEEAYAPAKVAKGRCTKAIVGFLQSNSNEVFVTTGFSSKLSFGSGNFVVPTSETSSESAREPNQGGDGDHGGLQRFTSTWNRENTDSITGLGNSVAFEVEDGERKTLRLLVAVAECDQKDNSTPVTAYPLGICTIGVDTKADELRTIVDVPVEYIPEGSDYSTITVGSDVMESKKTGRRESWLSRKMNALKCMPANLKPERQTRRSKRRLTSLLAKAETQQTFDRRSDQQGSVSRAPNEGLQNHLKTTPLEQAIIRLDVDLKRKESNVELSFPSFLPDATGENNSIESFFSFGINEDNDAAMETDGHAEQGAARNPMDFFARAYVDDEDSFSSASGYSEDNSLDEKKVDGSGKRTAKSSNLFAYLLPQNSTPSKMDTTQETAVSSPSLTASPSVCSDDSKDFNDTSPDSRSTDSSGIPRQSLKDDLNVHRQQTERTKNTADNSSDHSPMATAEQLEANIGPSATSSNRKDKSPNRFKIPFFRRSQKASSPRRTTKGDDGNFPLEPKREEKKIVSGSSVEGQTLSTAGLSSDASSGVVASGPSLWNPISAVESQSRLREELNRPRSYCLSKEESVLSEGGPFDEATCDSSWFSPSTFYQNDPEKTRRKNSPQRRRVHGEEDSSFYDVDDRSHGSDPNLSVGDSETVRRSNTEALNFEGQESTHEPENTGRRRNRKNKRDGRKRDGFSLFRSKKNNLADISEDHESGDYSPSYLGEDYAARDPFFEGQRHPSFERQVTERAKNTRPGNNISHQRSDYTSHTGLSIASAMFEEAAATRQPRHDTRATNRRDYYYGPPTGIDDTGF